MYYNGDITTVAGFKEMQERFPTIDHWMIGRGLIADPFLPSMIKADTTEYPKNRWQLFREFHDTIYHQYDRGFKRPYSYQDENAGILELFLTNLLQSAENL